MKGKPTGRPKLAIDPAQVEALAQIQCTQEEMAAVLGCSVDTLQRRYADVIAKGKEMGKASLRRLQWKAAQNGDRTILIWLGKQMLGQQDEQRVRVGDLDKMSDEELQAVAAGRLPTS